MCSLDIILEALSDSQLHSLDDLRMRVNISEDCFYQSVQFLTIHNFLEHERDSNRVKIKSLGLRFLELPLLK